MTKTDAPTADVSRHCAACGELVPASALDAGTPDVITAGEAIA